MNARNTRPTGLRLLAASIVCASAIALGLPSVHGAPPDNAVSFEIAGGFDVQDDGFGQYADFRLAGGDPCMESSITGGGFTFITLNRNVDGTRCDDATGEMMRQYFLNIASAEGCAELETSGDATSTGEDTCVMDGHRNPRIRVDRLRQQGGLTTIDFLIGRQGGWMSGDLTYEIQSVELATITPQGDGSLKLEYDGPFRFARFGLPKTKGKPGSGPPPPPEIQFDMSLEMVFRIENY
jgi:hypothetical protein